MTSTHSIYKEFDEQLKTMIGTYANNNPAPRFAKIENVSPDKKYVDVSIGDGVIKAVERFGSKPVVGTKCILVFMNGNYEEPVAICNEYIEETLCYNLLNNGCFQKVTTSGFEDWTGGTISTLNYYYNQSTARLLPETSMTSSTINITSLEDKELGEVSEIMLFYFYIGAITIEVIDKDTGEPVTFAPENLGNKKEILEPVDSWHYARTHFLLREHKNVAVKFNNTSKTQSAYLDGVRLWKPDFGYWYPSEKDEYELGNMLNKNYLTILKDPISWKNGVTKIIHDIDSRLKQLETSSGGDGSSDHTHDDYLKYHDTIYNSEHLGGKTAGDFALVNHSHANACYVAPFLANGRGDHEVRIPMFVDEQYMFIANKSANISISSVEWDEDETLVTVSSSVNSDSTTYYLLYWSPQSVSTQLGTHMVTNNLNANIGEKVDIVSTVVDDNGSPVNKGEVEYNVGDE